MKQVLLTLALLGGAALAQTNPAPATPATPAPATPAAPMTPAPTSTTPTPATPTSATPSAASPAAVVATIGGQNVSLAEFEAAFRLAVAGVLNNQGLPYSEEMLAEFAGARPDYLKVFVRERSLEQLARATVKPDTARVDARLAEARKGFGTDAEFTEALQGSGYTSAADLRAELERQDLVDTYLAGIQKRNTFGDFVVSNYYNLYRTQFQQPREACAGHILVATQAEATALAKQVGGGADFAALAKSKSLDPGSAAQGGDLGCFEPGQMVESFDKASFSGPLNQAQVVQSEFGWHVLRVSKRSEGGLLPLAQAAPLIREKLSAEAAQKYVDAQVTRLKVQTFPAVVTVPASAPAKK